VKSLAHPAQSERLRAQHRLAQLGAPAVEPLAQLLKDAGSDKWARIHAIWTQSEMLDRQQTLMPEAEWARLAVEDADADVRAQAARALGLRRAKQSVDSLLRALADTDASVRMHAAVALGRIGDAKAALIPIPRAGGERSPRAASRHARRFMFGKGRNWSSTRCARRCAATKRCSAALR
jgi:HEAT repeat protein